MRVIAVEWQEAYGFLGQLRIHQMREIDQEIHPISENSTFQLMFIKLNVLCIESENISEFYNSLLVSSAFCYCALEGWEVGTGGRNTTV